MIVILRQDGVERSTAAARQMWEAIFDLPVPTRVSSAGTVEAMMLEDAAGLILCDLDAPTTRHVLGAAAFRRIDRPPQIVAAVGLSAEVLSAMTTLSDLLPAIVLSFPRATGPVAWRAIALTVSSKVYTLQCYRAETRSTPMQELIQTEVP